MHSKLYGKDISRLWPISYEGQSDTACFDNGLEFLVQGGYSLPHAVMMMIPEAWAGNPLMDEQRRAFYEYHAAIMEPWDGPAAIAFTDGRQIGATLDRNGLRPARYLVTRDDRIVMASEMGVLKIPEEDIITKWRLQPGKMLLVDLEQGRLIPDDEIKAQLAKSHPYREWLDKTQIVLEELPDAPVKGMRSNLPLLDRQQAFGYTQEDITILMTPMASTGEEANGSMGNDTPISALSDKPKPLFTYFKQNFAQVTNPPIDPIREELVMSFVSIIGPRPNLFDLQGIAGNKRLEVRQPILTDGDLEKIRSISDVADNHFRSRTLDTTFHAGFGAAGLEQVLDELCARAESAVREGINIIILSDRMAGSDRIPIPSLLACAAVHHHLIRTGLRTLVGEIELRQTRGPHLRRRGVSERLREAAVVGEPVAGEKRFHIAHFGIAHSAQEFVGREHDCSDVFVLPRLAMDSACARGVHPAGDDRYFFGSTARAHIRATMDEHRMGQRQPGFLFHLTDRGGERRFSALDGARDQRIEERRVAGHRGARPEFVDQHDLIARRVIAEHADRVAAFHDIPHHLT